MAVTYEYVGKTGGGKPVDMVFSNAASGFTIDLPDGAWGLVFQYPTPNWSSTQTVRLRINGVEVGDVRGATTPSSNVSIMVRHQTGPVVVTFENASGRISSMSVTAFPDPT